MHEFCRSVEALNLRLGESMQIDFEECMSGYNENEVIEIVALADVINHFDDLGLQQLLLVLNDVQFF